MRLSRHPVGVLSLAVLLSACGNIDLPFSRRVPASDPGGRYTITSPQKEIFLLDTATGRTWILGYEQGVARWHAVVMEEEKGEAGENSRPEEPPATTDNAVHPEPSSSGNR